ncbi:MAG: leucine-rich repeat protein [Firmicutes bacterium]|nr:leucine-rich repeat protein [Bacillota bacterium]
MKRFVSMALYASMIFSSVSVVNAQDAENGAVIQNNENNSIGEEEMTMVLPEDMDIMTGLVSSSEGEVDTASDEVITEENDNESENAEEENDALSSEGETVAEIAALADENGVALVLDEEGNVIKAGGVDTGLTAVGNTYGVTIIPDLNSEVDKEVPMPEALKAQRDNGEITLGMIKTVSNADSGEFNIKIPDSVEVTVNGKKTKVVILGIRSAAFNGSKSKKIELPDSITYIGEYAFQGCNSLESLTMNFNVPAKAGWFTDYAKTSPSLTKNITVKDGAVSGLPKLTDVNITVKKEKASNGKYIDFKNDIFKGCTALKNVKFDMSAVETTDKSVGFGTSAFEGCSGLEYFEMPEYLNTLGNNTFKDCTSLKQFRISSTYSSTLKYKEQFANCLALEEFLDVHESVGTASKTFSIIDGCLYNKSGSDIYMYPANKQGDTYELPENTINIETYAFGAKYDPTTSKYSGGNKNLVNLKVTAPKFTQIKERALSCAEKLQTVEFAGSCGTIGTNCFENTEKLKKVVINGNLGVNATDGTKSDGSGISSSAFYESSIEEFIVNGAVKTIGSSAFNNCTKLGKCIITGHCIEAIGTNAFTNCGTECSALPVFVLAGGSSYSEAPGTIYINSCKSIDASAFEGSAYKTLTLECIAKLGNKVFYNCPKLETVDLSEQTNYSNAYYTTRKSDRTIGTSIFEECRALTSVILAPGWLGISSNTFANCEKLEEVSVKDEEYFGGTIVCDQETGGHKAIGYTNFCSYIASGAFSGCVSLKKIPEMRFLTSIDTNAFLDCKNLEKITFTKSALSEMIKKEAFSGCSKLKFEAPANTGAQEAAANCSIPFVDNGKNKDEDMSDEEFLVYNYSLGLNDEGRTVIGVEGIILGYRGGFKSLTVREPIKGAYLKNNEFKGFRLGVNKTKLKEMLGRELTTEENALSDGWLPEDSKLSMKPYLEKLTFRNMSIEIGALSGYTKLKEVLFENIPDGTDASERKHYIGDTAFSGCTSLEAIEFSDNIETLGKEAFKGCKALEKVFMPKNCKTIGVSCFMDCSQLRKIKLNVGLDTVLETAFSGCNLLTTVTFPGKSKIEKQAFKNCSNIDRVIAPSNASLPIALDPLVNAPQGIRLATDDVSTIISYAAYKKFDVEKVSFVNGIDASEIIVKGQVLNTENAIESIKKDGVPFTNIKAVLPKAVSKTYEGVSYTEYDYTVAEGEDYVTEGNILEIKLKDAYKNVPFVIINGNKVAEVHNGVATYAVGENEHVLIETTNDNFHYITIPKNVAVTKKGDAKELENYSVIKAGDVLTIKAEPETGYVVDTLTVNGNAIKDGGTYTVGADENVTIAATFKPKYGTVVVPDYVTVTKDGKTVATGTNIQEGETFVITANPPTGVKIKTFTVNGNKVTGDSYTYTVKAGDKGLDIVLKLELSITIPEYVTVTRSGSKLSNTSTVEIGQNLVIKAEREGYLVSRITVNGYSIVNGSTYTVKKNENVVIAVEFVVSDRLFGYAYGDANANNQIDFNDAAEILKKVQLGDSYVTNLEKQFKDKGQAMLIMDVDGSGKLTSADAAQVMKKAEDGSYEFPIMKNSK